MQKFASKGSNRATKRRTENNIVLSNLYQKKAKVSKVYKVMVGMSFRQIPVSVASSPANSAGHQDLHTPPTSCALLTTGGTSACLSEVPAKTTGIWHKAVTLVTFNQILFQKKNCTKLARNLFLCLCHKCGKTAGICQLLDMASKTHQRFTLKTSTKLEARQPHPMTAWQHVPNNLVCHKQPTIWAAHEGQTSCKHAHNFVTTSTNPQDFAWSCLMWGSSKLTFEFWFYLGQYREPQPLQCRLLSWLCKSSM